MASSHYYKLSLIFVSILAVAPAAMKGRQRAEAQLLGPISSLLGLLRIDGVLFCTPNGSAISGTAAPVFPHAAVELQCGLGSVISTSITNESGSFSIMLNPLQILLSSLLNNCHLTVTTPLSTCNASLPSTGVLVSALESIGSIMVGLLNVTLLVPSGFRLSLG